LQRGSEPLPVVDQLEAMEADEAETLERHIDGNLEVGRADVEAVPDRVRPCVDDLASLQISSRPLARCVVNRCKP
jgi:hypothetical protein